MAVSLSVQTLTGECSLGFKNFQMMMDADNCKKPKSALHLQAKCLIWQK